MANRIVQVTKRNAARLAAREMIFGDGTSDSLQRVIDLSRIAVGLPPATNSVIDYVPPERLRAGGLVIGARRTAVRP